MKKFMESDHNVLRDKAVFIAIEEHDEDLIDFLKGSNVKIFTNLYDAVEELGLSGESLFKAGIFSNNCNPSERLFRVDSSVHEIESANAITDLVSRQDLEQELREEFRLNPTNEIFECTEGNILIQLDSADVNVKVTHMNGTLITREICRAFAVLALCDEHRAFDELARYLCINVCAEWES